MFQESKTKRPLPGLCITVALFEGFCQELVLGLGVNIVKNYTTYEYEQYWLRMKVVRIVRKVTQDDMIASALHEDRILLCRTKRHRTALKY
jgi:hypothetical protein